MLTRTLSALLLALPALAAAQDTGRGWYATLYGTWSQLGSTNLTESTAGPGLKAKFDAGYGFGGAIGWRYGNGWAAELEWDYRRHKLGSLNDGAGATLAREGDYASNILFLNGLYRFAPAGGWTPYAGAGLAWVQEIDFDLDAGGGEQSYSKGGKTGWQLIGGAERSLGGGWALNAHVRWLNVGEPKLKAEGSTGSVSGAKYNPLSLHLGLSRSF
jgi:opacity protein-like surface antigen